MTEESKQPLVSVIMPCYKMGRFIGEALESVGKQTYSNWEVIAVDDCGPEDGTRKAVDSFAKNFPNHRIIYHRHEKNGGVSAARNTAIGLAQGEYLAFLDPDDYYFPHKLEEAVSVLHANRYFFVTSHVSTRYQPLATRYSLGRRSPGPSRRRQQKILLIAEEVVLVWKADGVGCGGLRVKSCRF